MSQSSIHESDHQQPLFDLLAFATILWKKKFLILSIAAAFVFVAGAYIVFTKPVYTASAVVLVDPRQTRTTASDNVLAGLGTDSAAIASQVAVISSRELLTTVFDDEHIETDPEFAGAGSSLLGMLTGKTAALTRNMIFERFVSKVSVERQGLTYVLTIGFKSADPEKAARIVNAIVKHYIASQVTEKSSANAEVTHLLTSRIAGLQQSVSDAERAVEDYKIKYNIFDAGAGTTLVQTQIDQLNTQLLAAQEQARQAGTRYEQAVAAGSTPLGLQRLTEILSSSAADKLRDDYNQGAAAIASAQATLGPRHPSLIRQQAELRRVEGLIVAEAQRITRELKAGLDLAQNNVKKIEGDIEALRAQSNDANRRAVELRQLERNADASRSVLDQFQKRSQETGQLEGLQLSDAKVISSAIPPDQATWPKPSLLLSVAALLGLSIGSAIALLLGVPREKAAETVVAPDRAKPDEPVSMPMLVRKPVAASAPIEQGPPRQPAPALLEQPVHSSIERHAPRLVSERDSVQSAVAEIKRASKYARLN
jgi:uncharacterized protein involved in exopolysaccharide biosynthesis